MNFRKNSIWGWAQLFRLPNMFTVPGDVIAGAALSGGNVFSLKLVYAVISIGMLYGAGLLLNDYFDRDNDGENSPKRPIPSGLVNANAVLGVAVFLSVFAIVLAWLKTGIVGGMSAGIVLILICIYDMWAKNIVVMREVIMGLCRAMSVFSGYVMIGGKYSSGIGLAIAVTGIYIAGITLVSRFETDTDVSAVIVYVPLMVLTAGFSLVYVIMRNAPFFAIAILLFVYSIVRVLLTAGKVSRGSMNIPSYIGRLIRGMIPLQAMWTVLAFEQRRGIVIVGMIFGILFVGAAVSSRSFYGS